jgi:hypothetical protein
VAEYNKELGMIRHLLFFMLGLLSFNANAQQFTNITTPGNINYDIGPDTGSSSFFFVTHSGSGTFTDIYDFSVASSGTENGILGEYEGVTPISLGIYDSSGHEVVEAEAKTEWAGGEQLYFVFPGHLNGGSYYFKIVGNADGVRSPFIAATYAFLATVNPVPEPSTYALMLLGLTGIGYLAMRRARKVTLAEGLGAPA